METDEMAKTEEDSNVYLRNVIETEPLLGPDHDVTQPLAKVPFPSCRLVLMFMGFLGFVNVYCLRVNLSVALVAMVNHTHQPFTNASHSNHSDSNTADVCKPAESSEGTAYSKEDSKYGEFNWDSHLQGTVLAAFFYGYITTQVVGGWLAERIGGKILFGGGVLVTSGLTLLTPVAARSGVYVLIMLRVLEGVGEGVTFPSMHALMSRWIPPMERSRAVTFVYAGAQLGTVVGMLLSGVLCDHGFAGGWPSVFYVFGALGCVWCFAWFILCHNSPAAHPRISAAELQYVEKLVESLQTSVKPSTPWMKIAVSRPVWACAAAHFSSNWGVYTMLTCLPKYMNDVLQFDMTQNGILSALPYIATWLLMTASGQVADLLRAPHRLRTGTVRKLFCAVGLLIPGAFLVAIGFMGCNRTPIVIAVVIALGISGIAMSGYGVNHLDLAPSHAGTLMGLTNTLATVPGFLGPQVVGALTYHASTRTQWQKVFYITTAIYCFGAAVFTLFGSGELQDWAVPQVTGGNILHSEEQRPARDAAKLD